MNNFMKNGIILVLLVFIALAGCKYNKCLPQTKAAKELTAEEQEKPELVKDRLKYLREKIKVTPLFEKWHYKLIGKEIRELYICDYLLLVETEDNKLYAIDKKSGVVRWIYTVEDPIDFKVENYKDFIYLLSLGNLHVLDKSTGTLIYKKNLSFVPSSPICATDNYLFIGSWDKFLYSIERETGERDWRYRIDGIVRSKPVVMDGVLFFASTDGNLYAITSHSGYTIDDWGVKGKYSSRASNVAGVYPVQTPALLYLPSRDYNLYCISRINGNLKWKFESGGEVNKLPWIVGNTIYVLSDRDLGKEAILFAIDGEQGLEKWQVKHADKVFFFGKVYDWVVLKDKKIAAVHNQKGNVKYFFDFSAFKSFASRVNENLGYIATNDGYIFAIEER